MVCVFAEPILAPGWQAAHISFIKRLGENSFAEQLLTLVCTAVLQQATDFRNIVNGHVDAPREQRHSMAIRLSRSALRHVMNADLPYTVIQRSVHIHPTVSELIPTVFGELGPVM